MKIEEIRDIVRLLRLYKSDEHRALDLKNLYSKKTKRGDFYKMLVDTKIQTDGEAAFNIYGTSQPDTRFKFLKSYFTSDSLNSINYLDLSKTDISDFTRAVYRAYKQLFQVSILLRLGSRLGAIALAKKTLLLSERYELHHVSVELLEQLRRHAQLVGNKREYEKYLKRLEWVLELLTSELKCTTLEQRISIHSSASTYIDEKLEKQAHDAMNEIEAELQKNDTYVNRMSLFRVQYMYHQFTGDLRESVSACEKAIAFMKSKAEMSTGLRIGEFEVFKLENYVLMGDYENGLKTAQYCNKYFRIGTNNWFTYKEFHFLLLMQLEKFAEANIVFQEVSSNKRYQSQIISRGEKWNIFRLYLEYIADIEHRKVPGGKSKRSYLLQQKRYQQRIKEHPTYSKDKRGMNVALLLINILLLLENNKKDQLISQYDALKTYKYDHLRGKNSHQSAILFKLIEIMVQNQFDFTKIAKKAAIYEKRLTETKPSRHEIFECVQILPPIWMWKRMRAALEANHKS